MATMDEINHHPVVHTWAYLTTLHVMIRTTKTLIYFSRRTRKPFA
jgi:hypothetical protein